MPDGPLAKSIVLCADGTGNAVLKGRGTNVFKLFEAVDIHGHRLDELKTKQVAFYSDGVGTQGGKLHRMVTGALGAGLPENVKALYLDLVRVYKPGDRIYLFGFSRGAFTVRTLAGLIGAVGVLKMENTDGDHRLLHDRIDQAYDSYVARDPARMQSWAWGGLGERDRLSLETLRKLHAHYPAPISFVGVWDTVAALGFPIEDFANWWNRNVYRFKFKNQDIPECVERARHAISIDDERMTFHPTLWREDPGRDVEQVWFAGVHSNVGGGYPKQGMSLVALDWMMGEAEATDLNFIPEVRDLYRSSQNVHDKLYDSREGLAAYYRYKPRDIGKICRDVGAAVRVHESVLERIHFGTQDYAPVGLSDDFTVTPYGRSGDQEAGAAAPVTALVEVLRKERDEQRLLHEVRPWIFRRMVAYWGLFAATLLILLEILQDGYYALKPGVRPLWTSLKKAGALRSSDGVLDWVRAHGDQLSALTEELLAQMGRGVEWSLRPETLTAWVPEVIATGLSLILVSALCYWIGLDARQRMSRHLGARWFARVFEAGNGKRHR